MKVVDMLIKLVGEVSYRGDGFVILENNGMGHRVFVVDGYSLPTNEEVTLFVHEQVREDERALYGFLSIEALELFWKFLSVSGVGAKSAQKIVSSRTINEVRKELVQGNLSFFTSVPGIGKKTAQKIILELQGRLVSENEDDSIRGRGDVVQALINLGYDRASAEEAVARVSADEPEDVQIRKALQFVKS